MSDPVNYWEDDKVNLYFKSTKDCSVDEGGAKKHKVKATAPGTFVTQVQSDLVALGYLDSGSSRTDGYFSGETRRAVQRFQRHAGRIYRIKAPSTSDDVPKTDVFSGSTDGLVDKSTAQEIRKWIAKGWVVPVGAIELVKLDQSGKMRKDAAASWVQIVSQVEAAGGTLAGPYGDTLRPLQKTAKVGTSHYSMHYCGRAVDINQGFGGGKSQRYFGKKDPSGTDMYWILYCKTDLQDGTQGEEIKKGTFKCWSYSGEKEYDIPHGHYINLTDMIQASGKFSRIKAQDGWDDTSKDKKDRYNKTEWWHFYYTLEVQETFEDELELIGFKEKTIIQRGWNTPALLDHKPG
jgi:peptidoglycan hydrolase-like protein with peptidoglycan-binding domain